jgi:hypothetical protein
MRQRIRSARFAMAVVWAGCGIRADRNQAACHALAAACCYKQHPVAGQVLRHAGEEVTAQIRWVAMLMVGLGIAAVEEVPVGRADLPPRQHLELHTGLGHALAFLADFLRLACCSWARKSSKSA